MAGKKAVDSFANYAALTITESAANTFTSVKFNFPFSIMDKMGLVVQRIEYDMTSFAGAFAASADTITFGVCVAATLSDVDNPADPLLVDTARVRRADFGTAASGIAFQFPIVKDFTTLTGGGILVAPNPLYGFVKGISAGAAATIAMRLFYTYMELGTDEYWQLVESRRIISN